MITELDAIEDDTDSMQIAIRLQLKELEDQLNPIDVMVTYRMIIQNYTEWIIWINHYYSLDIIIIIIIHWILKNFSLFLLKSIVGKM